MTGPVTSSEPTVAAREQLRAVLLTALIRGAGIDPDFASSEEAGVAVPLLDALEPAVAGLVAEATAGLQQRIDAALAAIKPWWTSAGHKPSLLLEQVEAILTGGPS